MKGMFDINKIHNFGINHASDVVDLRKYLYLSFLKNNLRINSLTKQKLKVFSRICFIKYTFISLGKLITFVLINPRFSAIFQTAGVGLPI
jgi:hypothetical protein